ncbi:hypothetical protein BH11BAC3_BH11BAC3_27610 [soil metagenome]
MESVRIFIASSAELVKDRKEFREFLSIENDRLHNKGVYLELVQWENFLDSVSQESKQADYNEELKKSAIVICLFYTKAGKYTQQEFDTALAQFKETGAPIIYTYFKEPENAPVVNTATTTATPADPYAEQMRKDLASFKTRLGELGHFYTHYKSIEDLKYQFLKQLDILEDKGLIKMQETIKDETSEAVTGYLKEVNSANIAGNNNINIQGGSGNQNTINTGNTTNQTAEKIINIDKIDNASFS